MGRLRKGAHGCALRHEAAATHVCHSESHGALLLCASHAGDHSRRKGHEVFTLGRVSDLADRVGSRRRSRRRGRT